MKKLFLILVCVPLFFTACKDDELSPLSVIIEGSVFDAKTNAAIEGAKVEITSKDKNYTATSNSSGYYLLESLPIGDYTVNISKDGYLSEVKELSSKDVSVNGKTEVLTINGSGTLSPLTESIELTVYKRFNSISVAAANVEYTLIYGNFGNAVSKGTTDEYGLLKIDKLPYDQPCSIVFDFVEGGVQYKELISYNSNFKNNSYTIYGNRVGGAFGIVESNLYKDGYIAQNFDVKSSITFKFTQPVDTNNVNQSISFSPSHTTSWSNGNTLLTIDPDSDLGTYNSYYLKFTVYNDAGDEMSFSEYFYTGFYYNVY